MQITWRADDVLVDRVRYAARSRELSVNEFMTRVLDVATDASRDPDGLGSVRERLAAAGLLAGAGARLTEPAPPADEVATARRRAARGALASDVVSEDRG